MPNLRKKIRYATVCSGIGAPEVAVMALPDWECVFSSDIEPFPNAVRAHHWPRVPNLGDMTRFAEWPARCDCQECAHDFAKEFNFSGLTIKIYVCKQCGGIRIDVLIGGTPCQSFSVAGLRKGLADPRGNLALTFLGIVDRYRPQWVLWENVPGVHSSWSDAETFAATEESCAAIESARSACAAAGLDLGTAFLPGEFEERDQTSDFDCFLAGLEELGYGVATRVYDAQYFGVAQRRRRVFVVAHLGGQWQRAAAVLFERDSLSGHPPPRRETGQGTAAAAKGGVGDGGERQVGPTISARTKGGGGLGTDFDLDGGRISTSMGEGFDEPRLGNEPIPIQEIGKRQSGTPMNGVGHGAAGDPMYTLQSAAVHGVAQPIAFDTAQITSQANQTKAEPGLPASTLNKTSQMHVALPLGIDGTDLGYALRATASHSGDKGAGGVNTTMVAEGFRTSGNCGAWSTGDKIDSLCTATDPNSHLIAEPKSALRNLHSALAEVLAHGQAGAEHVKDGEPSLTCNHEAPIGFIPEISPTMRSGGNKTGGDRPMGMDVDTCDSLISPQRMAVRRLTPRECERLQGFPDDFTLILHRGKPAADGPRYKALGNSMAVPNLRWLLHRIQFVMQLISEMEKNPQS